MVSFRPAASGRLRTSTKVGFRPEEVSHEPLIPELNSSVGWNQPVTDLVTVFWQFLCVAIFLLDSYASVGSRVTKTGAPITILKEVSREKVFSVDLCIIYLVCVRSLSAQAR